MNKLSIGIGFLAAIFAATTVTAPAADAKPAKNAITKEQSDKMLQAPVVTVSVVSNFYKGGTLEMKNFRDGKELREYLQTALKPANVKSLYEINGISLNSKTEHNYSSNLQDDRINKSANAHFEINGNFKDGDSARLRGWDLSGVDLSRSLLRNIDLTGVNLAGASLDGADLENVMLAGIYAPNTSWKNVTFGENVKGSGCIEGITTVLSNADFTGSPFKNMNWGKAIMNGAILPRIIIDTNFEGADLRGADGYHVSFDNTLLSFVNLEGTNFTGATFNNMGDMRENSYDENTRIAGAKYTGKTIPQYDLVQFKEAQEQGLPVKPHKAQHHSRLQETPAQQPQLAWRPGG
jgi:uncharacterized protein YjbI with pentapeptide repeats